MEEPNLAKYSSDFMKDVENISHKDSPETVIKFRNYRSKNPKFKVFDPENLNQIKKIEEYYGKKIKTFLDDFTGFDSEKLNLVPKKDNFDLKRILEDKETILKNKTDQAIKTLAHKEINKIKS